MARFETRWDEDKAAVASQINDIKEKLPFLKHRIDDLFPKWPEKKQQLLEDLENGFIRRVYDLPDHLSRGRCLPSIRKKIIEKKNY